MPTRTILRIVNLHWIHKCTYLKPFGTPYILRCNYDLSYLSISISSFYEDCLSLWTSLNASSFQDNDKVTGKIHVVWNNKNICINNQLIYSTHLIDIYRVGDMLTKENNFPTCYDLKVKGL